MDEKKFKMKKDIEEGKSELPNCRLCYTGITDLDESSQLSCVHVFHSMCLVEFWMQVQEVNGMLCPICNKVSQKAKDHYTRVVTIAASDDPEIRNHSSGCWMFWLSINRWSATQWLFFTMLMIAILILIANLVLNSINLGKTLSVKRYITMPEISPEFEILSEEMNM